MKTLLQIGASLNYGAPGRIAEQIGLLARNKGWDVYMAHGNKYKNPTGLKTYQTVSPFGEIVHEAMSFLFDMHGLASSSETKKLCDWIDKVAPDVIHLHNIHGYFLNYRVLFEYLKSISVPIVWTIHDFWPITGHCAHFDFNGCNKWKNGCNHCQFHSEYPSSVIERSSYNYRLKIALFAGLDRVTLVPVSNWVASILKESFLKDYPIQVIHNGVDVDLFFPQKVSARGELGIESRFVLLGVASPWGRMKGFADYLKLREILPDEYTIVMVGLTKKQIERLPYGILGIERTQNQDELARLYSMADATLNLSYQETFGMTTVEGLACGTPGIVYNRTASPELVTAETGAIVEAGNIEALARAVEAMCSKGKDYYRDACRDRARTVFNKEASYKAYISLYEKLLRAR